MNDPDNGGWAYINSVYPRAEWWRSCPYFPEQVGRLFRVRGLFSLGLANLSSIGSLFFWVDWKTALAFAIPAVFCCILVYCIRLLLIYYCVTDAALKDLMYNMRERVTAVLECT